MTTLVHQDTLTEMVTFKVDQALCGMDIQRIEEIIQLSQYTRVPQAPAAVLGMVNLRGQIVTIIDLARRIGLESLVPTDQTRVIIVNSAWGKVGLVVHHIDDVVPVDLKQVKPAPANLRGVQGRYFTGVCKREMSLIGLLDIDSLLSHDTTAVATAIACQTTMQ